MTEPRLAGPILDALGVTFELDDHDHVTEVLVIGKTTNADTGSTGFLIGASDNSDWITQYGLLAVARRFLEDADIEEAD